MGKYIIKRILLLIPILIGATFLVFAIMEISPGDPALTILGADANEEAIARIHEELGLDRPFIVRYGDFLLNLCKGDLGKSYRNELPVTELIMDRLPNTIILASEAIVLAIVIGLPVGCRFCDRCKHAMDRCARERPAINMVSEGHGVRCFLSEQNGGE